MIKRVEVSVFVAAAALFHTALAPARAAEPFALIVVPDTQNYTDDPNVNTTYNLGQVRWIRDNMANLNIKFVMHLGDHQNPGNPYRARTDNIYEPDLTQPIGNVSNKETVWGRADAAIQVLDNNNIPYSLVPGNHDYLDHDTKAEPWLYLKTFGPQRYINDQSTWAAEKRTYGGASPVNPNNGYAGMNTYHRFDAGGYKFLNIALQFDPDDADLAWAQQIINENPNLPTIITTHAYVNTKPAASDYQHADIFNKLVKNNPQIVMTFNGHLTGSNYVAGTNIAGQTVHQMLVDFQASQLDAPELLNGDYYRGGGVLRQLLFEPDSDRVTIKDYSVVAKKFLPSEFKAPDNDGDIATYSTPGSVTLDLDRFGLPNGAGIKRSKSFQHNVGGYTGGRDTMLDENAPADSSHGDDPTLWVDGDRNGATAGAPDSQVLLRFDQIFGAGNLPDGARVDKAQLRLHTSDLADSQSTNTIAIYRLLKPWTTSGTWNSQTDGISIDGLDAILGANGAFVPDLPGEFITLDVTESLAAWMAGAPNYGWALLPGGGNGWQLDSFEHPTAAFRPQLMVNYTMVPEPAGFLMLAALSSLLTLRRQSRAQV